MDNALVADKVSEAVMYFNAMSLHLSTSNDYDFVKFYGKTRKPNVDSSHKHYWQFNALYKKFDYDKVKYCRHLYTIFRFYDFERITPNMLIRQSSKSKVSFEDILDNTFKEINQSKDKIGVEVEGSLYPVIYNKYTDGEVSLEFLFAYDKFVREILVEKSSMDIVYWPKRIKELKNISNLFFFLVTNMNRNS